MSSGPRVSPAPDEWVVWRSGNPDDLATSPAAGGAHQARCKTLHRICKDELLRSAGQLSYSQEIAARLHGYPSFHAVTAEQSASLFVFDDDLAPDRLKHRRKSQIQVLRDGELIDPDLYDWVLNALRSTSEGHRRTLA